MKRFSTAALAVLCCMFSSPKPGQAADTLEPFDHGASDVEVYLGVDGLGSSAADHAPYVDMFLGYGVAERFSAGLGLTLETNGYFQSSSAAFLAEVFGTPLDTDHVDLDIVLDAALSTGDDIFHLSPFFELNLDVEPDQASWGVYLRGGLEINGAESDGDTSPEVSLLALVGLYWTVHEGHQLLLEADAGTRLRHHDDSESFQPGSVVLGYNVTIHPSIELISHVFADLSDVADGDVTAGLMLGFLGTLGD